MTDAGMQIADRLIKKQDELIAVQAVEIKQLRDLLQRCAFTPPIMIPIPMPFHVVTPWPRW